MRAFKGLISVSDSLPPLPRSAGVFHPLARDALLAAVDSTFDPADYPTPVMQAASFLCGCSDWWLDPCRVEFRKVG